MSLVVIAATTATLILAGKESCRVHHRQEGHRHQRRTRTGPPVKRIPTGRVQAGRFQATGSSLDTRTATLRLPVVTASVSVPRRAEVAGQPARYLPALRDSKRLVFYAGVGALAAFEVVKWPVALLIAAGPAGARQARPSQQTGQPADHQHGEHTAT